MLAFPRMLTALHIRDFAIIDEVSLNFEVGLTVLTGETGAGKSILVDALELVLGGRGDAAFVRHGARRAEIGVRFDLDDRPEARDWLGDQELDDEDSECHLRRIIQADGRSRGFINGRPVPIQSLAALGEKLVDIHGQHEHQSLLHRDHQMALLDGYGGHDDSVTAVERAHDQCRELSRALEELPGGGEERDRQADYLRHQIEELEGLDLAPGEIETLESDQRRLAHARELMEACNRAIERLDGDGDMTASNLIAGSRGEMESLRELDERLREPMELLDGALIQLRECVDALHHYVSGVDLDPERLAAVEDRLGAAHGLARKHRVEMGQLPEKLQSLRGELDELESADSRRRDLQEELQRARETYDRAAAELHDRRRTSGKRLSEKVGSLMESLGMAGGRFEVALERNPDRLSRSGTDTAEFLVSANPGQPPGPLRKVASGGELSRIALAIQVAAIDLGGNRTLIFDEVDAGIGGAVAEIVGERLRGLGEAGQTLCVTHLPQVAAQGHHHFLVTKTSRSGGAHTRVDVLGGEKRTAEIARMLGGVKITDKTTDHAREMLERTRGSGFGARESG